MPDSDGRPYLRETRSLAQELGIVTRTNARQRKAELESEVQKHPVAQYEVLKQALTEEVAQDA
jgi:hypothetical protein